MYAEIFPRGGANLGYGQKRGGGRSLCEVLHPILARGVRMTQGGGGGGKCPSPPPLNYSPARPFNAQYLVL